jgi:hypothetical protein
VKKFPGKVASRAVVALFSPSRFDSARFGKPRRPARHVRASWLTALAAPLALLALAAPASALLTRHFETSFGSDGTSATDFERPLGLSVDQSTGSIYVGDAFPAENVQRFTLEHEPEPFAGVLEGKIPGFRATLKTQLALDSSSHTLYMDARDESLGGEQTVRAYNANGEPSDFTAGPFAGANEITGAEICGVAVDASGEIYVSEFASRVSIYAASGEPLATIPTPGLCNLAVDSHGVLYAIAPSSPDFASPGPVEKLTPSAPPPVSSSTTFASAGAIDEGEAVALAVDPASNHVLIDEGSRVAEYDETGARLGSFGAAGPGALPPLGGFGAGLAVNATSGRAYVAQSNAEGQVEVFGPTLVVPDVTTGEATEIDPPGSVTLNGTVDPDELPVTGCRFQYGTTSAYGQEVSCEQALGAGNAPVSVSAHITGLEPGVTYHFRLLAANANGSNEGEDATVTLPPKPALENAAVTNLTATSAELNATVNPGGLEVSECRFEYGQSMSYEHAEPCEQPVGSGTSGVPVSRDIALEHSDITYHWRIVVASAAGTTTGADHTFIYDTSGEGLPDGRAYEMVTPPEKDGGLVGSVLFGLHPAIAESGSSMMVSSIQCFADAESCEGKRGRTGSLYELSRSETGWTPKALAPAATAFPENSVWLSSPNTGRALYSMPTPQSGEESLYAREPDGDFPEIGPLTTPIDEAATVAATSDLSHVIYGVHKKGGENELFEFSGIDAKPPFDVGVSGGAGSTDLISGCSTALGRSSHGAYVGGMSADGETVFFTADACAGGTGANENNPVPVKEVFARIGAAQTVPISEPSAFSPAAPYAGCGSQACVKNVNEQANWRLGLFIGASIDGSKAFFTSEQQLTDDATQGSMNLYEAELGQSAGTTVLKRLSDVSAGETSGHVPDVRGEVAMSGDGSHVYFVASGVLTTAPNSQQQTASEGANNLYVFERDAAYPSGHVAFIAQLDEGDREQWGHNGEVNESFANVTPDGRFLVFESRTRLTPDDTRTNGAAQIFRYDAQTGDLTRISSGERGYNDDGNAGAGNAEIATPGRSITAAGPARTDPTMSHDGAFVFFDSPIALTPHALNDVAIGTETNPETGTGTITAYAQNVYEWHEGQISLISDGRDTNRTYLVETCRTLSAVCLVGTDATGSNVFFTSSDQLVPQDTDTQVDIYDARICTSAEPCIPRPAAALPPCSGEACHGTPAAATPTPATPTASFNGPGNPLPPASPAAVPSHAKAPTRAQLLAKALKSCRRKHNAHKRRSCEAAARKHYRQTNSKPKGARK